MRDTFTIYRGDDVSQTFVLRVNKLPIDLTTAVDITIPINNADGSCLYLKKSLGGVTLGSSQGTLNLIMTAAQSLLIALQPDPVDIDIVVTDVSNKNQTYRSRNRMFVVDRIC